MKKYIIINIIVFLKRTRDVYVHKGWDNILSNKKRNTILILIFSVIFVVSLVLIFTKELKDKEIVKNISDYSDYKVTVDDAGNSYVYVPLGVEIQGDTEGLNVTVVDTGLPTVVIDVPNAAKDINGVNIKGVEGIKDGSKYVGNMTIINGSSKTYDAGLYNGSIQSIEALSSPSDTGSKKSYEIALPIDSEILDMKPEKEWMLMSCGSDFSLLRSYTAFELSKHLDMIYTPQARFVEVFINGEYAGPYLLTEKVQVNSSRLAIPKLKPENLSGSAITGSYLMQIDSSRKYKPELNNVTGSTLYFNSTVPNILPGAGERSQILVRGSKYYTNEQFNYIKQYLSEAENALFSDTFKDAYGGFREYFDEDSFIKWYIIEELFKNPNDATTTAPYFYKQRASNLRMGPIWIHDSAAGNSAFKEAARSDGWYVRQTAWFERMFEDEAFENKFKDTWRNIRDTYINQILESIDVWAGELELTGQYNLLKWYQVYDGRDTASIYADSRGEYYKEVEAFKNWLIERINWIDNEINQES